MWKKLPTYLKVNEQKYLLDEREIAASYHRCRKAGVNPDLGMIEDILDEEKLSALISCHSDLITIARSLFEETHSTMPDKSYVFILTDDKARIIGVFSAPEVIYKCAQKSIVLGASLLEKSCGTNAVALALRYDEPVVIKGSQHFCRIFYDWYCIAVPVIGESGKPIACIDLSCCHETSLNEKIPLVKLLAEKLGRVYQKGKMEITGNIEIAEVNNWTGKAISERQQSVLKLIATGLTCKEIAEAIKISPRTVESHLEKLRKKLSARTTAHLIAMVTGGVTSKRPPIK